MQPSPKLESHTMTARRILLTSASLVALASHAAYAADMSGLPQAVEKVDGVPSPNMLAPGLIETPVASGMMKIENGSGAFSRSEEHTSELQSLRHLVCRL